MAKRKADKKVIVIGLAYIAVVAAIFSRIALGTFRIADVLVSVGLLLQVVFLFKHLLLITKILFCAIPAITACSFLGLPIRAEIIACFICFVGCWIYSVWLFVTRDKWNSKDHRYSVCDVISPPFFSSAMFFIKMVDVSEMTCTEWENEILVCLITSVVLAVSVILFRLIYKRKKSECSSGFWGYVGYFFLSVLVSFALMMFVLQTLNYALDFSEGEKCEYTVIDKDIHVSRRGGRHCELHIFNDGDTKKIDVTSGKFQNTYLGDIITLSKHKGFFGIEYYEYK